MCFFVILVANSRKIKTLPHGKEHVIAWTEHGVFPRVPFCLMLLGFFGKMWFVSVKAGKCRKSENEKLRQCPYLEPNQRHMCIMGLQSVSSRNVASHIRTQASATVRSLNYFYPSVPIMRPWRISSLKFFIQIETNIYRSQFWLGTERVKLKGIMQCLLQKFNNILQKIKMMLKDSTTHMKIQKLYLSSKMLHCFSTRE